MLSLSTFAQEVRVGDTVLLRRSYVPDINETAKVLAVDENETITIKVELSSLDLFGYTPKTTLKAPRQDYLVQVSEYRLPSGKIVAPGDDVQFYTGWGDRDWPKYHSKIAVIFETGIALVEYKMRGNGLFGTNLGAPTSEDLLKLTDSEEVREIFKTHSVIEESQQNLVYKLESWDSTRLPFGLVD